MVETVQIQFKSASVLHLGAQNLTRSVEVQSLRGWTNHGSFFFVRSLSEPESEVSHCLRDTLYLDVLVVSEVVVLKPKGSGSVGQLDSRDADDLT